jgi:hypothetical protein
MTRNVSKRNIMQEYCGYSYECAGYDEFFKEGKEFSGYIKAGKLLTS